MDYPKSVPGVGLVGGKFVDEDAATGRQGSLIPASWGNQVTDELLAVIEAAGLTPGEHENDQLLDAMNLLIKAALESIPKPLGHQQTWKDVTANRAAGVTYTNTTGRAIALSIIKWGTQSGPSEVCYIIVDGLQVGSFRTSAAGADTQGLAIIPAGSMYLVSPGAIFNIWQELR